MKKPPFCQARSTSSTDLNTRISPWRLHWRRGRNGVHVPHCWR
jgi:hypothetical protein